ncbi:MAG: hypothetical protein R3B72_38565 [Polyangiaceae bacterium]
MTLSSIARCSSLPLLLWLAACRAEPTTDPNAATTSAAAPPTATTPKPPPTATKPMASAKPAETILGEEVRTSFFGKVPIADGEIAIMDGGIHGVQGHTLRIPAKGPAHWQRRVDSLQPHGKPGEGDVELTPDELNAIDRNALWQRAAPGSTTEFFPPVAHGPPRWVWAIVLRRGKEIRLLQGGATTVGDLAPPEAKAALTWVQNEVDTLGK